MTASLADTAEVPEVGELVGAVPPPEGPDAPPASAREAPAPPATGGPDAGASPLSVEAMATGVVPAVPPPSAAPPPDPGAEIDVSRAGRLALRQARRQRHLWAAVGIAVLVLVLVATVLIVGVVR